MKYIIAPFMCLALVGSMVSLLIHACGYLGIDRPFGINPWLSMVGIFVVWPPAILISHHLSKDFPQREMWKATLRGCPKWMKLSLYCICGYAFIHFFASLFLESYLPSDKANDARMFSGHAMIFYYAAFAILYSAINVSSQDNVRRCGNGHPLRPNDKFCNQCGENVGSLLDGKSVN